MDLGINGKHAFICASSQGLGLACASALAAEGVNITLNGRYADKLQEAVQKLRQQFPHCDINAIAADLTRPEQRAKIVE